MSLQERIAAYLFAALNDKRVNVLCFSKPDGSDLQEVIKVISEDQKQLRFEYFDALPTIAIRNRGMRRLISQIYKWEDARALRSTFDDIFDSAKAQELLKRNVQRNGFVYYLRSLAEGDLHKLLDRTYMTFYPNVGQGKPIGGGAELIAVYDNVGEVLQRDGFEAWLRDVARDRTHASTTKMIVVGGDTEFPREIVGLGNWGYSVDLRGEEQAGEQPEKSRQLTSIGTLTFCRQRAVQTSQVFGLSYLTKLLSKHMLHSAPYPVNFSR